MANDKEWKKATKAYTQGNNRYNHFDVKMELSRNIRRIAKWIIIAIVIVMFLMSIMSPTLTWYKLTRKDKIRQNGFGNDIEEIAVKTNMFDNGLYIYKIGAIPGLEIHALSIAAKDIFVEDTTSRITKYYFEKWNSNLKKDMKVEESYQDCKFGFTTKKDWFMDYKIYIDAKTEKEFLKAVETIIDFREYMNNLKIVPPCYIRINGKEIRPIIASYQLDDDIREKAKIKYEEIK